MDFSDYEHYALAILNASDGAVRSMYQSRFKEVMIDEYQDINRVQEAIIQSLKRGDEATGNLFMVGMSNSPSINSGRRILHSSSKSPNASANPAAAESSA